MKRINYRTMDIIKEVTEAQGLYEREALDLLKRMIVSVINKKQIDTNIKFSDNVCKSIHNVIVVKTESGAERRFIIDTHLNGLGVLYFYVNEYLLEDKQLKKEVFRGHWSTPTEYSKKRESILSYFKKPKFDSSDHAYMLKDLKEELITLYGEEMMKSL